MDKSKVAHNDERLFHGERLRKDGRYEYRYTDCDGVRRSICNKSLSRLRLEEAKLTYLERMRILYGLNDLTLNDMYEVWLAGKVALKGNTKHGYQQIYDSYVRNNLGKKLLEEIKTIDLKSFYMNLKIEKSISTETICRIQNVLFQIFQHAVDSDIIWKNPADRATKELKRSHPKHASTCVGLNEKQAKRLLNFVYEKDKFRDWYPILCVMIFTGLRIGELVSLRWCDVNLPGKCIEVNHNAVYYAKEGEKARYHFSDWVKTPAGIRIVPFNQKVVNAFEMEKEILKRKKITCVQNVDGYTDFVFLNRFGKMFDSRAVNKALVRIVGAYNMEIEEMGLSEELALPHLSCHCLRHTYAVILCERGINIKVMQMLLGHKDISTTMDIYTNITKEFVLEEYARKIEEQESCI